MERADGRKYNELRPVEMTAGFTKFAEGSVLIRCGDTVVLCNASVEDRVPPHVRPGHGWVTAEYSMLPRANRERSRRDVDKLKLSGRSAEIQRLIGRSLRAAVDMALLGERTITIDCDVLQGDGGTRTASVTGGFAALALACRRLVEDGDIGRMPIRHYVAGVSAGIVAETPMLDLQYSEDSRAQVDLNCIMNELGEIIEIQGTVVLCNASVEDRVPPHVRPGHGWVTAEYSMLPRANRERSRRDVDKLKLSGRSAEIQRLIGRSLRAAVDMALLGERTITIDCDVLQGDGGTRTASVTGGFAALALACRRLVEDGDIGRMPIRHYVAGVSAGIVAETPMLDLQYSEDSRAQVDLNCIMNELGEIIEIQGTGEGRAFSLQEQQALVELCARGNRELIRKQKELLGDILR